MEARASLSWTQLPVGAIRAFLIALLAAFLLGGAGGYIARGASTPASTTTGPATTNHPLVTQPAPYSSPATSPAPPQFKDPDGFVIPI